MRCFTRSVTGSAWEALVRESHSCRERCDKQEQTCLLPGRSWYRFLSLCAWKSPVPCSSQSIRRGQSPWLYSPLWDFLWAGAAASCGAGTPQRRQPPRSPKQHLWGFMSSSGKSGASTLECPVSCQEAGREFIRCHSAGLMSLLPCRISGLQTATLAQPALTGDGVPDSTAPA